jgi:hypothetical protein
LTQTTFGKSAQLPKKPLIMRHFHIKTNDRVY